MNKKAKQDLIACALVYAFMLFCFVQTLTMKNGSETMPRLVLALAFICNTLLVVRVVRQLKTNDPSVYTSIAEIKIPVLMFLGVVLYCLVFSFTNYFIATAVMLVAFYLIEKIKPVWLIPVITIVYLVFIYVLFVVVLKVPLIR